MSPKKRRGGTRSRCRGVLKRNGSGPRQPLSPSTATADDSDVDGISTDCNVSLKHALALPSSSLTNKKHAEYNEERELSLPRLKPTVISAYSSFMAMLSHDENSNYVMTDDELDRIQWDLEAMLTAIIIRKNIIKEALNTFATMQFARSLHRMAKNPRLPMIRPRAAAEISPVSDCHQMKVEFDPTSKDLPLNKTESANKFWSLVEPYLAHIKKEDLKWLEDMVISYSPNKKLYNIPPLGEHYSKIWAKEELEIQKNQSSCFPRTPKKLKLGERISPDVIELVNKANFAAHDGNICTPIYQRVVASLVEHSHTSSLEQDAEEHFPDYDDEENPQEMTNICKEFYAERNVKKQLNKLGLIGHYAKPVLPSVGIFSSAKPEEDKDEVLEELIKCDNALAQIREMNKNHLTILLDRCRKDYYQQTIRNKLDKVNTQILDYKREQNESWSKEKKMAQIVEEDEELSLLLELRARYIKRMQSILHEPSNFLSSTVSDESDSSDEESDLSKVNIKIEPSEHNTSEKQITDTNENGQVEVNFEQSVNIKEEIMDEKVDYEKVNDIVVDEKHNKRVSKEELVTEEIEKTVDCENKAEKSDKDNSYQENQTEPKTNDDHESKMNEESNSKVTLSTRECRVRSKKSPLENEPTSKIELRKQIKIKQEPVDYDHESDTIDDAARELRPRKLNESHIYFEPYDGTSSDDSDFSFPSD